MPPRKPSDLIFSRVDWPTFVLFLGLIFLGWLVIYSVGQPLEGGYPTDPATFLLETEIGKQTIFILLSLFLFVALFYLTDWKLWTVIAWPVYIVTLLMLVGVLVFGAEIKGATSWFRIAGFTLQPSEFAKFGTCLAVAAYFNNWRHRMDKLKWIGSAMAIWLLPVLLIMLQPDAGSALVFFSFLIVMYREGLTPLVYLVGGFAATMFVLGIVYDPQVLFMGMLGLGLLLITFQRKKGRRWQLLFLALAALGIYYLDYLGVVERLWLAVGTGVVFILAVGYYYLDTRNRLAGLVVGMVLAGALMVGASNYVFNNILQPHQQDRINVWLQPEKVEAGGARYNLIQSRLAISAGGLTGKGYLNGTMTKLDYVPEQNTDFIFCALGEEQGFAGVVGLLGMFFVLLLRIIYLAERQRNAFSRVYAYGVAGILFIHVLVNIGMTMGLLPIIGIPLPFLSKGGSSLFGFTLMIAVLLKLDKHRAEL
ncbi:MAG: rod shape-determining protein RodA [Saprospiraceae bacterium]